MNDRSGVLLQRKRGGGVQTFARYFISGAKNVRNIFAVLLKTAPVMMRCSVGLIDPLSSVPVTMDSDFH